MSEAHDTPEVDIRTVMIAAGGIVAFLVIFLLVLYLLFPVLVHRPLPPVAQFPAPSVTADERTQRLLLERAQNERLSGRNGMMPIARAMAIIAAKGPAAYEPVQSTP